MDGSASKTIHSIKLINWILPHQQHNLCIIYIYIGQIHFIGGGRFVFVLFLAFWWCQIFRTRTNANKLMNNFIPWGRVGIINGMAHKTGRQSMLNCERGVWVQITPIWHRLIIFRAYLVPPKREWLEWMNWYIIRWGNTGCGVVTDKQSINIYRCYQLGTRGSIRSQPSCIYLLSIQDKLTT